MSWYVGVEMSDHLSPLTKKTPKALNYKSKKRKMRKTAKVSRRVNRSK